MILKKGIQVKVIAGKDKGKTGEILEINRKLNKIKIKSVGMIKRHTKPNSENPKGGIIEKQLPIDISNLSLMTKDGEKTRIGFKIEDGKKVRISKKSKETI